MKPDKLRNIFERMLAEIGGEKNQDINWYLKERPETISRDSFFRETVFAIWVGGKSRVAANSFLERAQKNGFLWGYQMIASWEAEQFSRFTKDLHGWIVPRTGRPYSRPVPKGANDRWHSIHEIANILAGYTSEAAFQRAFFGGKIRSADLDQEDIRRLVDRNIPFVKEANASFIIRNMGGEAIKRDRWVDAFLGHYHLAFSELERQLEEARIALGFFDIVLWAYCESFIHEVSSFAGHLTKHFDQKENLSCVRAPANDPL